ncbi:MAG: ABC transporter permease [Pyrinomonadaceae bacterium MAG19_C2-C3]|nr:ABC transporter permease [Pyrinomonadaceae bacterium MAG19_C2-C3]
MRILLQDVRYGIRMLWKRRGFTLAAVLCLALGIGATTTVYSTVDGMLFRPLPFADADRVMALEDNNAKQGFDGTDVAFTNFLDWREQATSFDGIAIYKDRDFALTGTSGEPERIEGHVVSANLFDLIGARPVIGRGFMPNEDVPEAERVALLSYALWQRRFAGKTEAVGQTIRLNGYDHTIVGVMPEGFKFPEWAELWTPAAYKRGEDGAGRGNHNLSCLARLKPGVTIEEANAEMSAIASRLAAAYPESNTNWTTSVKPFREARISEFRVVLYLMLGAVGFVLLIACANVTNLLLARGAERTKEIAIRTALGASRWRVVRQLLVESVMIGIMGGVVGVLLALWGIDLVTSAIPIEIPYWMKYTIDARVMLFTLLVSLVTGILFGLAPALQASKTDVNETLKEGGRGASGGLRRNKARNLLVVTEIALSLVLLVGAALMMRSFVNATKADTGFNAQNVLTLRLGLPVTRYAEEEEKFVFYRDLLARIESLPGVRSASAASIIPLADSSSGASFVPEGAMPPPGEEPSAQFRVVTSDYFQTMEIPLTRGRALTERDTETSAPPIAVVNERLAKRIYPNDDPVGKRFKFVGDDEWVQVVGIVPDTKTRRMDAPPEMQIYVPFARRAAYRAMTIVVRTDADPARIAPAVRKQISEMDAELPVYDVQTMEDVVAQSLWQPRLFGGMFLVFAAIALVLASVGVYGVIAYSVSTRTHEFGIRMALGAQAGDVLRLVIKQGMILVAIGVALGLIGAFLLTRVLAGLLYGVTATDPLTFLSIPLLLICVALVASFIPARRATKVDPMVALRHE